MRLLYKGFDKLDVAFRCQISMEFMAALEIKQGEAREGRQRALLEFNGQRMFVGESGANGGFAFTVDTGPEGGNWVFKRPNPNDPWGARVSVRALPLMLYGMSYAKESVFEFLDAIGCEVADDGESIARIDYAMDFLIPGFELEPENFVMHSHMNRKDHIEEMSRNGKSGVVTSITAGKMPGRQVIVYDKRRETVASNKTHMLAVWNANLHRKGLPEITLENSPENAVWRVEVRLGKDEFKKRWKASTWREIDRLLGDMFLAVLSGVRYATPSDDSNRARWPDHPLWRLVRDVLGADLHEMSCHALPSEVKAVIREEHAEMMRKQMQGLTIAYAVTMGYGVSDIDEYPELIESTLQNAVSRERKHLERKFERTRQRLVFI